MSHTWALVVLLACHDRHDQEVRRYGGGDGGGRVLPGGWEAVVQP